MSKMLWCDLETTGLNPNEDVILEIGLIVTDETGRVHYGESKQLVSETNLHYRTALERAHNDEYLNTMHTNSGLFEDLKIPEFVTTTHKCDNRIEKFLSKAELLDETLIVLCGSSVHFDLEFIKKYLPRFASFLHYRVIDVSSIRETMRIVNPSLYKRCRKELAVSSAHRVISDIYGSIELWAWERENFLITG